MAPVEESGELADEPGGALDGARADLQRWRRGLSWRDGGVKAAVAVLSRLESGSGQCMQLGAPQLQCTGVGTRDGLGAAGGGCLL